MVDSTTVMELHQTLPLHTGDVHCIAVTDDIIATTSGACLIRVFNTSDLTEKSYSPLNIHKYHVIHCVVSPDGKRLVSTSMDGRASVVDLTTGKLLHYFNQQNEVGMRTCCISPNGYLMAVGACDGSVSVVEMESYKHLKTMSNKDDESILSVSFSPDTRWLMSGHSVTGDIKVWDAQYLTDKPVASHMMAHELGTHFLQVKPGDAVEGCVEFLSAGADCLIGVWRLNYPGDESYTAPRLTRVSSLVGHTGPVYCVRYSSDAQTIISCGGDYTLRIWNNEGECMFVNVDAHKSFVNSLTVSSDNTMVYSASCDRTVKVWKLTDTYSLQDVGREALSNGVQADRRSATDLIDIPVPLTEPVTNGHQKSVTSAAPTAYPAVNGHMGQQKVRGHQRTVKDWTVDDVCGWLSSLGLSKYTTQFKQNDIDGQELIELDKDTLEKELKINAFGARSKIMRGLETLLTAPAPMRETGNGSQSKDVDHEFLCPITHEVMNDPVVASDGYSYERSAIESWLAAGKSTSPMTNVEFKSTLILPNYTLKTVIDRLYQSEAV